MPAYRVLGLFATALVLAIVADSATPGQPGVKTAPQLKPGMPPGGVPVAKPPVDPGKNPLPVVPGVTPGQPIPPGTTPGTTPAIKDPQKKKDWGKWPEKINGRSVDECVKEMRSNPDPMVRESAVRTLPLYGPIGREKGSDNLIYAMTKDTDINVKMTAVSVGPTVLLGFAEVPDQPLMDGLKAIIAHLDSESVHVRYDAVQAIIACGPYVKTARPDVVPKLVFRTRESSSYQLRRSAVAALAMIGQGIPPSAETGKGIDPDTGAVTALLDVLRTDVSVAVRKEAISGLIAMGPVAPGQQKPWRTALENVLKPGAEKDKSAQLWVRVLILKNDPAGVAGNVAHLNAIAEQLKSQEAPAQIEACQALGVLGEEAKVKLQGLLDLIADPKEEENVVAAAIMAAGTMKSQGAIIMPVFEKALMHEKPSVRKIAQDAIDIMTGKKK